MSVIHSVIESNEIMSWKSIEWQREGEEEQTAEKISPVVDEKKKKSKREKRNILVKR